MTSHISVTNRDSGNRDGDRQTISAVGRSRVVEACSDGAHQPDPESANFCMIEIGVKGPRFVRARVEREAVIFEGEDDLRGFERHYHLDVGDGMTVSDDVAGDFVEREFDPIQRRGVKLDDVQKVMKRRGGLGEIGHSSRKSETLLPTGHVRRKSNHETGNPMAASASASVTQVGII